MCVCVYVFQMLMHVEGTIEKNSSQIILNEPKIPDLYNNQRPYGTTRGSLVSAKLTSAVSEDARLPISIRLGVRTQDGIAPIKTHFEKPFASTVLVRSFFGRVVSKTKTLLGVYTGFTSSPVFELEVDKQNDKMRMSFTLAPRTRLFTTNLSFWNIFGLVNQTTEFKSPILPHEIVIEADSEDLEDTESDDDISPRESLKHALENRRFQAHKTFRSMWMSGSAPTVTSLIDLKDDETRVNMWVQRLVDDLPPGPRILVEPKPEFVLNAMKKQIVSLLRKYGLVNPDKVFEFTINVTVEEGVLLTIKKLARDEALPPMMNHFIIIELNNELKEYVSFEVDSLKFDHLSTSEMNGRWLEPENLDTYLYTRYPLHFIIDKWTEGNFTIGETGNSRNTFAIQLSQRSDIISYGDVFCVKSSLPNISIESYALEPVKFPIKTKVYLILRFESISSHGSIE